jgi:hypothetical protein
MGPKDCPETSVLSQPTLRNNPEDGRILKRDLYPVILALVFPAWRLINGKV